MYLSRKYGMQEGWLSAYKVAVTGPVLDINANWTKLGWFSVWRAERWHKSIRFSQKYLNALKSLWNKIFVKSYLMLPYTG